MLALFSLNQVTQLSGQVIYENLSYMSEAAINISNNEPNVLPFFPPLFFPEIGDIFILLFFFFFLISYTFRLCEEPQRISTCNRQFALQTKKQIWGQFL